MTMRDVKVLPSLLSADFSNLGRAVASVADCGAGGLHCDVMDGHFVPNITFGPMVVHAVRLLTELPLFVHLMIERPQEYIEQFVEAGAGSITVHAEACVHLHRVIQCIKDAGARAGVALNPSTPVCVLENVIADIDSILIMTVNPGFGGQSFIETMLPKISQARRMADDAGADLDIAVDGGIDLATAPGVVRAGANVLVAGSFVFAGKRPAGEACGALRLAGETAYAREEV